MEKFLFGPYPLSLQNVDQIFGVTILVSLTLAVFLMVFLRLKELSQVNYNLFRRFKNLTIFYGVAGLFWLGFRYENASYLSWRLWIASLAVAGLVWLIVIVFYLFKNYKKDLISWRQAEIKQKYLSKK